MAERTGGADPARVLPLLWRSGVPAGRSGVPAGRSGVLAGRSGVPARRSGLNLDAVVTAAIELADDVGIDRLSMRKLAERLGVGAMTLYGHVPGKAELVELMVDQVFAEVEYESGAADPTTWRSGLEEVAEQNLALLTRHPWLTDVDTTRPPLGPGTIGKYDSELRPLLGTGLTDVEIDRTLALVLDHVRSSARQLLLAETPPAATADGDWWEQAGPLLAGLLDPARYPVAARIGEAAGEQYGAPADPRGAYTFGLRTILDGVANLIAHEASPES